MSANSQTPTCIAAPDAEVLDYQNTLRAAVPFIHDCYRKMEAIEVFYRETGVLYHRTNAEVRNPELYHQGSLMSQTLKRAFELTSEDDYNAYFRPHQTLMELLNRMRDEVRFGEPVELLKERASRISKWRADCVEEMERLWTQAKNLANAAEVFDEYQMYSPIHRWCVPLQDLPSSGNLEWTVFCKWVRSLPETKVAVRAGRLEHELAKEMLSMLEDRFTDRWFTQYERFHVADDASWAIINI
ncbi:hypothetical protein CC80DRAFT_547096 [Byssothecium circinans]|uniref:Uncharacterized protein n=1 Tax=Byssothecium circinans TaxID=147558 RepID=A0A6A5TYT8_9PLEO|nr:hypothetical protein CC80DRAFT_547096 [Byssothecium circinans]